MKLFKIVIVLVILLVVALGAAWFYVDTIAKTGIEKGATYALGVDTTVKGVSIGLVKGESSVSGLHVANPDGYGTPHFMHLNDGKLAVSLGSLTSDTVEAPDLTLTGLNINLEKKKGKANYQVILDNLKKFESKEPDTKASGGKKFVIRKIAIKDISVNVDLVPDLGDITKVRVEIPEIQLSNVGSDSDSGVLLAELSDIILKAVLGAVVNKAGDLLPKDMLTDLGGALAQLGDIDKLGAEVIGVVDKQVLNAVGEVTKHVGKVAEDITKSVGDTLGKDAGKAVEDITKGVGGDLDKTFKGVGDLLGGKKKDDEKK